MLTGLKTIHSSAEYKNYLNSSVNYYIAMFMKEVQSRYPDLDMDKVDLSSEQFRHIYESLPYKPMIMGELSKKLGIDDKLLTPDLWEDLFNGYLPEKVLPKHSPFRAQLVRTKRGKMLPLNDNPSKINKKGEYTNDEKRRASVEALFSLPKGVSIFIAAKQMVDGNAMNEIQTLHKEVVEEIILPYLLDKGFYRVSKDGSKKNEKIKKQGLAMAYVSFFHTENRNIEPSLHFHDQILSTIMTQEGKLAALDTDKLFNSKGEIDALYQGYMRKKLTEKYGITFNPVLNKTDELNAHISETEKCVASFDISQNYVPKAVTEFFSKRTKELEEELRVKGLASTGATRAIAQKATRDDKQELSPSELLAQFKADFAELGYKPEDFIHNKGTHADAEINVLSDGFMVENFFRLHKAQKNKDLHIAAENPDRPKKKSKKLSAKDAMVNHYSLKELTKEVNEKVQETINAEIMDAFRTRVKTVDFTPQAFRGHVIKQAMQFTSIENAITIAERALEEQCVYVIPKDKEEMFLPLYAYMDGLIPEPKNIEDLMHSFEAYSRCITKESIRKDKFISDVGNKCKDDVSRIIDKDTILKHVMAEEKENGFKFSKDQMNTIFVACQTGGMFAATDGTAGSGKSTVMKCVVKIQEAEGYNVWGTAIASTATDNLSKSAGIQSSRCMNSSLLIKGLQEGSIVWDDKTLLLWDESAMAALDDVYEIVKHAAAAGARINFIGEAKQLQPVGVGNTFHYITQNFATARLTSINRQKLEQHKQNVRDFQAGKAEVAMRDLYEQGNLVINKTLYDNFEQVANEYVASDRPEADKIIMSGLNGDNDIINEIIKKKLIEAGKLKETEQYTLKCQDGVEREFGEGDRITFFQNTKTDERDKYGNKITANNSETGVIRHFTRNRNGNITDIGIEMDELDASGKKKLVIIPFKKLIPFRHGYAGTVYKAQGASKPLSWGVITSKQQDASVIYVMASRHKENFRLFLSDDLKDEMSRTLRDKPILDYQKEKLEWLETEHKVKVGASIYDNFLDAHNFLNKYHHLQMEGNKTHVLDDFTKVVEAMSTFNIKKNVADFTQFQQGANVIKQLKEHKSKVLKDASILAKLENKKSKLINFSEPHLAAVARTHRKVFSLRIAETKRQLASKRSAVNKVYAKPSPNKPIAAKQKQSQRLVLKNNNGMSR